MKKVLSLLAVLALSVSLCACGASGGQKADGAASGSGDAVKTAEAGKLIMATNAYFPPYEYYDGSDIVGIDAEIIKALGEKLGLETKIEDMEFDSIIAAVQSGKVDVGMAGMTVTEERLQIVNFSDSYAKGIQSIIIREDSDVTSIDDLHNDKMIGVQLSTTGDIYATDDFGADHVTQYSKGADAVLALTTGKVDAVIIDNEPAKNFVAANEGLKILETPYAEEEYAICISKDNESLLKAINGALKELTDDGTIKGILDKYISAD